MGVIVDIKGVKGLLVEEIARSLSRSIEEFSEIVNQYSVHGIQIRSNTSSGFIDGSSVYDERRGSIIVLFSAYGLVVQGFSGGIHMYNIEGVEGARRPIPAILFPRIHGETRINTLMRTLELLVARSMISQGVENIFLDGSYLSVLLAPSGVTRQSYRLLTENLPSRTIEEIDHTVSSILRSFYSRLDSLDIGSPYEEFTRILDILPEYYSTMIYSLTEILGSGELIEKIIDYSVLTIEENLSFYQLTRLLDDALKGNVRVYWVAKDTNSRFLARINHLLTWVTDVSLLDHIWANKDNATLRVNDLIGLEGISAWRTTRYDRKGSELVFEPEKAIRFYEEWGRYDVWYFKLSKRGPVLQLTYPQKYGREAGLEALGVLRSVSDPRTGYPKPLILVHHATRLEEGLAEGLGDSIWTRLEDPLLKVLLARKARVRLL